MDLVEKDSELYPILSLFLVQVTGLTPVAALAEEHLLTVRSYRQIASLEPDGNTTLVEELIMRFLTIIRQQYSGQQTYFLVMLLLDRVL